MLNDSQRSILVKFSYIAEVIASQIFQKHNGSIPLDDLRSIGNEALIDAVLAYDPTRGASYKTFLTFKVRTLILDQLRLNQFLSRRYMRYYASFQKTRDHLLRKLKREPYHEEVAPLMGVSLEKLIKIASKVNHFGCIPIDSNVQIESHYQLTPVEELIQDEASMILKESILCLKPKTRAVLKFHYYSGLRGYQIADIFGLTEGRISQIKRRGLRIIKQRMLTIYGGEYEG